LTSTLVFGKLNQYDQLFKDVAMVTIISISIKERFTLVDFGGGVAIPCRSVPVTG
jgi:hypothetical protein